jgi:hypothetical protein
VSEHEHEREREHERTGMAERESARARRARRVRAVARTMLGDGCGAVGGVGGSMAAARGRVVFLLERTHADQSACARRERAGFEPPRAPCSRRKSPHANSCRPGHRSTWARPAEHEAIVKPHSICTICNCGGKWCCAARAPRCIAANASTRRAAAPKAACPTSSVAMLMHDAMRQGEVVQHGKDCAAWWRTMPHACTMMSARRPQAQAECRKAARAAAAWPRRGRLRSWQARLSQLTWSRRATRRALYERNCESLQELTFSQSPCCRGRFVRNPSTRTIVVSLIAVVPA